MFFVILSIMFQYFIAANCELVSTKQNQSEKLSYYCNYYCTVMLLTVDTVLDTVCKLYPVPVDLIFLVDGSSNVSFENFLKLKVFMGDVVNGFEISGDGLKVGVVQYGHTVRTEFNLNSLKTKENTLTMLEMLEYLNGTSKFTGRAIKYVSTNEFQTQKGSRHESNKIVALFTDGFSQDDVIQPCDQGRQLGIEYFIVTITEHVNYQELFQITKDLKEHVIKLNSYSKLKSAIQNRLVKKRCDGAQSDTGSFDDATKNVDYTVKCEKTRITVTVKTVTAFKGKIFIQGFAENQFCRQLQDAFAVNETTMLLMVPTNDCGVRAGYQLHPPGTYLEAKLVVSFHPVFITKMDQALNVRCFFSENSTAELTFSKSDLRTKVFYPITPSCSYTIRLKSENGPRVSVVSVGQKVFHVWECGVELANYSIHVHTCSVDNGREIKSTVLDDRGCSEDLELWPSVDQKRSRTKVWQELEAFKFSGPTLIYFTCRISFCDIEDVYCQRFYSPFVNCKSNRTTRSDLRIRSSDINVDVYTRMSVIETEGNEDFRGYQANSSSNLVSSVCFNSVHISVIVIVIFIIYIALLTVYIIRVKVKGNMYVVYSKRLLCFKNR